MSQTLELESNLTTPGPSSLREDNEDNELIQALPPADEGADAWKFLLGCFIFEGLLWGFPLTSGIFVDYYSSLPQFASSSSIAIIGVLPTSIYFLGAPLATPLVKKFQRWQRHLVVVGWAICVLSLIAGSFASTVPGLIATQGVLYGLGFCILYFPILRMLDEWFIRRRGLAYGVLAAGGGFFGVGLPLLMQTLLNRYGYRTTLRAVGVGQAVLIAPVLPLMKNRLPTSAHGRFRMLDLSFLSQPLFWCFAASNVVMALGYYIPSLYLPTYASALGLSGTMGAIVLAMNNFATVLGQVTFGYISDRTPNILVLVFVLPFVSSIAAFTIWGFAQSLGPLMVFAVVYGWFAGAFGILWPRIAAVFDKEDIQPVYSMMAFGKGIGNLAIGPISAALLQGKAVERSGGVYGLGRFEPLILFLGGCMLCSSLGIAGWPLSVRRGTGTGTATGRG